MESTGDRNSLRQRRTVVQGSKVQVENGNQTPIGISILVGVFLLLLVQLVMFGYVFAVRHHTKVELIELEHRIENLIEDMAIKTPGRRKQVDAIRMSRLLVFSSQGHLKRF